MITERTAVRAILMTPALEILLLRIRPPHGGAPFWITPGGGLEPGETIEAGIKRELQEELGLNLLSLGPLVWRRQHTFNWGKRRLCQNEQYHMVLTERFEPKMSGATELLTLDKFRWWPLHELERTEEELAPITLVEIVQRYLLHGPPHEPIEIEVLID